MRLAVLFLVLLAYPFTMADPVPCLGGACATNEDGSCAAPGLWNCGTASRPSACVDVTTDRGAKRCICQALSSGGGGGTKPRH